MNQILRIRKTTLVILLLMFLGVTNAQRGQVTGTITDQDGLPLPGVNIIIKGTSEGTQTDFDGNYKIKCNVGDLLLFTYIGQKDREVKVTPEMFGIEQITTAVRKVPVEKVLDTSYQKAVQQRLPSFLQAPNIEESNTTHNAPYNYINVSRIAAITTSKNKVQFTYLKPDIYFEIGASSLLSVQFIKQNNLPKLQTVYAQGMPNNQLISYFPPESNVPFSYGPRITSLAFDGSDYPFDSNGALVNTTEGNGQAANVYSNNPFEPIIKSSTNAHFLMSSNDNFFRINYWNKSGNDMYGKERSALNEFDLSYEGNSYNDITWQFELKRNHSIEKQPNINGFQNNLLLNAMVTPATFENQQGIDLANDNQRSFSNTIFNNPEWLLKNNRNQISNKIWIASLKNSFRLSEEVELFSRFNFLKSTNEQDFGVSRNTVGFLEGYSSDKNLNQDTFDAKATVKWEKNSYTSDLNYDLISSIEYTNKNLDYEFIEKIGFEERSFNNPEKTTTIGNDLSRATLRWYTSLNFRFFEENASLTFVNNSVTSTIQNSKWLAPSLKLRYDLYSLIDVHAIRKLKLAASYGYSYTALPLFYNNQSHNSLQLEPQRSLQYTANNDLFAIDGIDLEEKKSYELNLNVAFKLFNTYWDLNTSYFSNVTHGSVFPFWENNAYQLRNLADVNNYGFEATLDLRSYNYGGVQFSPRIIFSNYRTKVLATYNNESRIPIAGFATISKNLIKDKPAGILVGTAFLKDGENNLIIDNSGYPLANPNQVIVGDPTPDFNLGFSSNLRWKNFNFNFVLDYQQGGDVWNGTQQVLNYIGTSKQSGLEREITNFVFEGRNQNGTTNTIPVDFANPENGLAGNRFIRYGFEGVAEEAIVDGSYLNLKSVDLSYTFTSEISKPFFREFKCSVYAANLFTIAKYDGASPYTSLYGQGSSQGIQFFNAPVQTEIGLKIKFKI